MPRLKRLTFGRVAQEELLIPPGQATAAGSLHEKECSSSFVQ